MEKYTVCPDSPSGGGGGDTGGGGGGGTGDGDGGTRTSPTQCRACGYTPPPPTPTQTPPITKIYGECNGLKQALSIQAAQHKEVVGYVATNGYVINFDTSTSASTDHDFNLSFPLYDSQAHLITNGPFQDPDDGIWKIEVNTWTNGVRSFDSYNISYAFHTHPIGTDPNGNTYDSNNPSTADKANASKWSGFPQHIVNANNEIVYNSTGVISTTPNHCP